MVRRYKIRERERGESLLNHPLPPLSCREKERYEEREGEERKRERERAELEATIFCPCHRERKVSLLMLFSLVLTDWLKGERKKRRDGFTRGPNFLHLRFFFTKKVIYFTFRGFAVCEENLLNSASISNGRNISSGTDSATMNGSVTVLAFHFFFYAQERLHCQS